MWADCVGLRVGDICIIVCIEVYTYVQIGINRKRERELQIETGRERGHTQIFEMLFMIRNIGQDPCICFKGPECRTLGPRYNRSIPGQRLLPFCRCLPGDLAQQAPRVHFP